MPGGDICQAGAAVADVRSQTQAHSGTGVALFIARRWEGGRGRGRRAEAPSLAWRRVSAAAGQAGSAAGPQEREGAAAAAEVRLGLLRRGLHRHQAPGAALAQGDTVGDADLQGATLPEAGGREVRRGGGVRGAARGPAAALLTHPWQCAASTPTSSPTRLSRGGCERCRHTTRSSWPRAWSTTSWSRPLVTLSPVT